MKTTTAFVLLFFAGVVLQAQPDLKLWYNKPAGQWVEALAVGNRKIGGMVYGGVAEELIQLNESTLYSGGPVKKSINPASAAVLPVLRKALFEDNDLAAADSLARQMQGLFRILSAAG